MKKLLKQWLGISKPTFDYNYVDKSKSKEQRCETCGGMFLESNMQKVLDDWVSKNIYFCVIHKKPYDKIRYRGKENSTNTVIPYFLKTIPEHYVEVNEDGSEIKKK